MATNNPFLARFDLQPALINELMVSQFESCLHEVAKLNARLEADTTAPKMAANDDFWFADDDWRSMLRPYNVKDGVLQIPVKGVLLHDFPYAWGSYATGYDYIWRAYQRGMSDDNVKGIALICDTPGGEVAGNFTLVDRMYVLRDKKEVRAFAMESAYSAGYSIASVAKKIVVSRTGGVGSIGVVTAHVDYSEAMAKEGVKVTFIHFGAHKVDGNPYEPLPKAVQARIQARIDELGGIFVQTVARNRGMDEKAIRDTEALTFTATQAVSNGLADEVGSLDDAIAAFAADLSLETEDEEMAMTAEEKAAADLAAENARTEGMNKGKAEGAKSERERILAIVNSDEGKKRPTMAMKMATGDKFAALDSDTVVSMLADMPEEKAETPAPKQEDATAPKGKDGAAKDFANAMDSTGNPNVGAKGQKDDDEQVDKDEDVIERSFAAAGFKPRKKAA